MSSVSTDELEGKPISNVLEAMQGTTPGLVIQQGSSTPGSVPSINIRGLNTMNNNDPLVIIDGIEGSLANLNPADIEQISIFERCFFYCYLWSTCFQWCGTCHYQERKSW